MTRCKLFFVLALYGALAVGGAHGGLAHVNSDDTPHATSALHSQARDLATGGSLTDSRRLPLPTFARPFTELATATDVADPAANATAPPATNAVRELPPAPSSLTLGLTALAGLGLYQAGRKVQFARLPDWYHTGGPQQIGYATPLDIESWDLPPCVFTGPTPHVPPIIRFAREAVVLIPRETLPHVTVPRGPPLISSVR